MKYIIGLICVVVALIYSTNCMLKAELDGIVADAARMSEVLLNAGAKDGGFVVTSRLSDNEAEQERIYFVIYAERAATSGSLAIIDGEHLGRIGYEEKIVKVINRDDSEWREYADKYPRQLVRHRHRPLQDAAR